MCAEIGYLELIDFECAELARMGTSAITPLFMYSVLHVFNVPSQQVSWFGHGGIEFPSLGIAMNGDGVYALGAGIRIRPNALPVDISYLDSTRFEEWSALDFSDRGARSRAEKELRALGWSLRKGRWACTSCTGKKPTPHHRFA